MMLLWWLILALGIFLTGYSWGRRLGIQEGKRLGEALAPLELRRQSQEKGYCQLCGSRAKSQAVYHSSLLML